MKSHLIVLLVLSACSYPICAQEAAGPPEKTILSKSPDGKYAVQATHNPDEEPKKRCDLIRRHPKKILLRLAESDEGKDRLDARVLWAPNSKRFAVCATYNHFGEELSVYQWIAGAFRKVELSLPKAEIPDGRKPDGYEWKSTEINSERAQRWQNDGSLVVKVESTLQALNSDLSLTSERTVVLGFNKKGMAKVLKSKQRVTAHE